MQRVGYLYEKLLDIELIKYAIHCAAEDKTTHSNVAPVLADIDKYAKIVYDMFANDEVVLHEPRPIERYDYSCNKLRHIKVPRFFPDQIIHWCVMLVLQPVIMKGMYAYCCGSVPDRGGRLVKELVEKAVRDEKITTVAKLDVHKFFDSVDIERLYRMFERKIKDDRFLHLIKMILDNGGQGLPIGYYTSQWFSNFYLQGLDHYIKEELGAEYYVRFVDDMVILGTSKEQLWSIVHKIMKYLEGIGLELKGNYQVWPIDSRPIDFVGFRFYRDHTELRKKTYYKLCRRSRKVEKTGCVSVRQARGILSLRGMTDHIDAHKLREKIDSQTGGKPRLTSIVSHYDKKKNSEAINEKVQQSKVA